MKKLKLTGFAVVTALVIGLVASGCSTVDTQSDMVALQYDGGVATSQKFLKCVPASTFEYGGQGDTYYMYPTSQRTFNASADAGAEAPPVVVVSKDNAELTVPVSITFTMDTTCETLVKFHDTLGKRDKAYWGGTDFADSNSDSIPDGWITLLNTYVGVVLDTTLDRAAQAHGWRALWNDPAVKVKLEQDVEKNLSTLVDDRMGGHYFNIQTVLIQKPDPVSKELKDAVIAEQAAVAKAKALETEAKAQETAAVAKARADQAAAEAQIAVAKAEAAQMAEQIRVLGIEGYLKKYGIDKGITPWPNPVVPGNNNSVPK